MSSEELNLKKIIANVGRGDLSAIQTLCNIQQNAQNIEKIHFLFKHGVVKACLSFYKYPDCIDSAPENISEEAREIAINGVTLQFLANMVLKVPGYNLDMMRSEIIREIGNLVNLFAKNPGKTLFGNTFSYFRLIPGFIAVLSNCLLSTEVCKPMLLNIDPEANIIKLIIEVFSWKEKELIKQYSKHTSRNLIKNNIQMSKLGAIKFLNDYVEEPFVDAEGHVSKKSQEFLTKLAGSTITIMNNKSKEEKNVTLVDAFMKFLENDLRGKLAIQTIDEVNYVFSMLCRCIPNSEKFWHMENGGIKTLKILIDKVWTYFVSKEALSAFGAAQYANCIKQITSCVVCVLIGFDGSMGAVKDEKVANFIKNYGFQMILTLLNPMIGDFDGAMELLSVMQVVKLNKKTYKELQRVKSVTMKQINRLSVHNYKNNYQKQRANMIISGLKDFFNSVIVPGDTNDSSNNNNNKRKTTDPNASKTQNDTGSTKRCIYCMNVTKAPKRCGKCKKIYCSKECQVKDWKEGDHKKMCKVYQQDLAQLSSGFDGLTKRQYKKFRGNLSKTADLIFQERLYPMFAQAEIMKLNLLDCVFVIDLRVNVPLAYLQVREDFIKYCKTEKSWDSSTGAIIEKNQRRNFMTGFVFSFNGGKLGSNYLVKSYPPLQNIGNDWRYMLSRAKETIPPCNAMCECCRYLLSKNMPIKNICEILRTTDYMKLMTKLIDTAHESKYIMGDEPELIAILQSNISMTM
jgi:hypothetical protein